VTTGVKQLLESFQALSRSEKYEAAVEVLRYMQQETRGPLPDEALVAAADELFRELDAREAADAHGESR
jgi:hypothetical protein